jgi:hypothetical protein
MTSSSHRSMFNFQVAAVASTSLKAAQWIDRSGYDL